MKIDDLKYTLTSKNITPEPREVRLGRRDLGRMLVIDRNKKKQLDSYVLNLPGYFEEGDALILNNSKRVPGILKGTLRHNNAQVELQFVGLSKDQPALCRIYPMHHVTEGAVIVINGHELRIDKKDITPNKLCQVTALSDSLIHILKQNGAAINAFFSARAWEVDYLNTFYATTEGSIESPLAGLHFTPELLQKLKDKGVHIGYVTLHSVGSWLPFLEDNIDDHKVFEEEFEMPAETARIINTAKLNNKKVVACGSTAIRTIESSATGSGTVQPGTGYTSLYIKPGYEFKIVDRYFTNFHQYKTSLMVLDAAFCGQELLMNSIEVAKERGYLFYEYGDAVFYI